jgi:hypothetical protein
MTKMKEVTDRSPLMVGDLNTLLQRTNKPQRKKELVEHIQSLRLEEHSQYLDLTDV